MSAARQRAQSLIGTFMALGSRCPAHSHACGVNHAQHKSSGAQAAGFDHSKCEYAVEMVSSTLRFGPGVTREVGMDLRNMNVKRVAIMTDSNIEKLPPFQQVLESVESAGIAHVCYSGVRCEPSDKSVKHSIAFAKRESVDGFVAVGGGSVIDTCKLANLYLCHPDSDFLDFIASPIGKGQVPWEPLKPLIAVPTTAGTGSETTGTAIFDFKDIKAKTGMQYRALRPTLGLVDPAHLQHMPRHVAAYSGFDVLCHGIESYTALPFTERYPRPLNPRLRPAYQGSNPISDVWATTAVRMCRDYLKRSYRDETDLEASSNLHLASSFAGVGFGNAGVHLCHGLSYAISGQVRDHHAPGYPESHALIPHGLSVVITAPAVFMATAPANPERHLTMAECLGADISNAKRADAGPILADRLRGVMADLEIADGLSQLGYSASDIPALVHSTIPQDRVLALSPIGRETEDIAKIFEQSLTVY